MQKFKAGELPKLSQLPAEHVESLEDARKAYTDAGGDFGDVLDLFSVPFLLRFLIANSWDRKKTATQLRAAAIWRVSKGAHSALLPELSARMQPPDSLTVPTRVPQRRPLGQCGMHVLSKIPSSLTLALAGWFTRHTPRYTLPFDLTCRCRRSAQAGRPRYEGGRVPERQRHANEYQRSDESPACPKG